MVVDNHNINHRPGQPGSAQETVRISRNGDGAHADPIPPTDLDAAKACVRFARGHRVSARARQETMASLRWGQLFQALDDTSERLRESYLGVWLNNHKARNSAEAELMAKAIMLAGADVDVCPDDPETDESPDDGAFRLKPLGAKAFTRTRYELRWLVDRVLVADQPVVVGAPKKSLKTTTMIDLAVSLASGKPFLNKFHVPEAVPTYLLSGESGGFVIQETYFRVCRAKGIDPESAEGFIFFEEQLPQLGVKEHLDELARVIKENSIKVVIIDPLYLCLLCGMPGRKLDAANLFDMGPLLKGVAELCRRHGATPILVHHFKKNGTEPFELPELEELAFAGIQEYARQWVMLKRRKRFEPGSGVHNLWLVVGGSAGHSGEWALDVNEGTMGDDFQGRIWDVSVKPASEVRTEQTEQTKTAKVEKEAEKTRAKEEAKIRQQYDDAETALLALKKHGAATKTEWRDGLLGWNGSRFKIAFEQLKLSGRIRRVNVPVPAGTGTRMTEGWEASPSADNLDRNAGGNHP
jgi:hypothetical protein